MHWTQVIIDSEVYNYEYFLQEDVCRLCWNKNAYIDLDNKKTQNTAITSLLDIIKECLEIDLHNINPTKLCENCCNELKRFYSYKTFCRESVQKLQEIIQKGITELNNKVLELSAVKEEVIDENIDNLDTYFDDTIDFEQKRTKPLSNSKFEKKYLIKRSPTYCHKCSIDLESEEQLFIHNNEVHGIEKNGTQFKCFGCEKRFKSRKTCVSHEVNFCKGLKDGYKCNICERYLPKRCIYESHMRDHRHNARVELPELMFKCGKCLKLFKSKELLKNHLVEHETAKNYVCDACGRIFTRLDYLSKHKLTHTGTKKHHCPHCDFKATQRSSLTVHLRKHTGERPYSCDLCPQRCISSSNLRAHRRRHLGDKKFECTICNKKFGYKLSLEEHISCTHVRSESHPCEYCGATYSRLRGLRRHLAAKHSKHKSKAVEQSILVQVTENADKIHILKDVEYELKDSDNVLLLKHQDGDVYMV